MRRAGKFLGESRKHFLADIIRLCHKHRTSSQHHCDQVSPIQQALYAAGTKYPLGQYRRTDWTSSPRAPERTIPLRLLTAKIVRQWLAKVGAKTLYIAPGSPWENGYCESFNGELRDELPKGEIFYSLKEARSSSRNGASTTTPSGHTHRSAIGHPRRRLRTPSQRRWNRPRPCNKLSIPMVQNIRQVNVAGRVQH